MVNYVSLIRRSDFNDLYRFGHLFVHNVVPFDGELSAHAEDKPLFDAVTAYMNTYEYSTEYLIIQFKKYAFSGTSVEIFIKDVVAVFALDADAHASLSVSLDPRINLQVTCWTKYFMGLSMKHSIRQSKAGMFNCFEIFGINEENRKFVTRFIPKDFVEDLFRDLFNKIRPEGNKCIWTYLLRYERHHPYWNDIRGYFSDAIHVYENYKQNHEIDYEIADEVPMGDVLINCEPDFAKIYQSFISNSKSREYMVDGCNYFAVAPLFLYMNNTFRDGGITVSKLQQILNVVNVLTKEEYALDFALAVALLGIKLGQELTYSCYYEVQNVGIFNRFTNSQHEIAGNTYLPIVDPENGRVLTTSEEIQDLLNMQYKQIDSLSEKIQEFNHVYQDSEIEEHKSQDEVVDTNEQKQSDVSISEQTPNTEEIPSSETGVDIDTVTSSPANVAPVAEAPVEIQDMPFEPIEMRKLNSRRTDFDGRNKKTIWARDQKAYEQFRAMGYESVNYFKDKSSEQQIFSEI